MTFVRLMDEAPPELIPGDGDVAQLVEQRQNIAR